MLSEQQSNEFRKTIAAAAERWQTSGYIFAKWEEQILFDAPCGVADRETGMPVTSDTRYCFSGLSRSLVGLCFLLLCDRKILSPEDSLSQYIPEYCQAERLTLRHLMEGTSGVPNYFSGFQMLTLHADPKHEALPERERFALESAMLWGQMDLPGLLALIGKASLDFEPGLKPEFSLSEPILLAEAMSRAAGKPYTRLLTELIFSPLGMDGIRFENGPAAPRYGAFRQKELIRLPEIPINCAFTADAVDIKKLMDALCARKLLSEQGWSQAEKLDEYGNGPVCGQTDGFFTFGLDAPGNGACLYFDQKLGLQFCHITNAGIMIKCDTSGNYDHFRKQMREAVSILATYPRCPHVVPYGNKNWLETCDLRVREDQTDFVGDVRTDIAHAMAFINTYKVYVMQEGDRPVGLLILEIDPEKGNYWIDTVLIDRRYQGRGYGKLMVGWGVEELKRQGAKQLMIGVNRFNIPAQRLYASLGFQPAEVFTGGMMMRIELEG